MKNDFAKKSAKPKNGFFRGVSKFLSKVFEIFRKVATLLYELTIHIFRAIVLVFNLCVAVLTHPTAPSVVAIVMFVSVMFFTALQWILIGMWLGDVLGFNDATTVLDFGLTIFGRSFNIPTLTVTSGTIGLFIGLGINLYQMSPVLWQVRSDFARALIDLKILTEDENEKEINTPAERVADWLNADYAVVKASRNVAYCVEALLVSVYIGFTDFTVLTVLQGIASLILPEILLKHVASTVSFLSTVAEKMQENAEEEPKDWSHHKI